MRICFSFRRMSACKFLIYEDFFPCVPVYVDAGTGTLHLSLYVSIWSSHGRSTRYSHMYAWRFTDLFNDWPISFFFFYLIWRPACFQTFSRRRIFQTAGVTSDISRHLLFNVSWSAENGAEVRLPYDLYMSTTVRWINNADGLTRPELAETFENIFKNGNGNVIASMRDGTASICNMDGDARLESVYGLYSVRSYEQDFVLRRLGSPLIQTDLISDKS